jgi:chemotaxis signal transduction protein
MLPTSPDPRTLCDENGVDREQIREMLRLTPAERLARVEEFVEGVLEIRELNETRAIP